MTRMESVRAATGTAKESVLHAAEVVAPYADSARQQAAQYAQHYAQEARVRVAPKVSHAASQARAATPIGSTAPTSRRECRRGWTRWPTRPLNARAGPPGRPPTFAAPRVEQAVAAAQPLREEALRRSTAALAALRGQVSPQGDREARAQAPAAGQGGRGWPRVCVVVGILAGGAFAAWRWWDKQANPDWLVEPPGADRDRRPPPAHLGGRQRPDVLDPEVQAKQAADEAAERDEGR